MHPIMSAHRHRSAGFGLLEALLLTFVLGGILVNGAFWLKAQTESRRIETQSRLLQAAQQQVDAYVVRFNRLPCPATATSDGVAVCSGGNVKGLLPWRDLGIDPSGELAGATRLGYLAYHSAAVDLTAASNSFEPKHWDGTAYSLNHTNTLDLCQNLISANSDTSTNGARVYSGATSHPVAYAIAHPGVTDADGDGNLFDGRNASVAAEMEDAGSSVLGHYDDRVVTRSFTDMYSMNNCQQLIDSANNMGLVNDVASEVGEQKVVNLLSAILLSAVNRVKAGVATLKTVLAAESTKAAVTTLGLASTALATAIGTCAILVGCALIPSLTWAVITGVAAVIAGAAAVIANIAGIAAMFAATIQSDVISIKAGVTLANSNIDLSAATSQALKTWNDATTNKTKRANELSKATTDKNAACQAYNSYWTDVLNWAHNAIYQANQKAVPKTNYSEDMYDSYLLTARSNLYSYYTAQLDVDEKQADYDKAKKVPESSGTGNIPNSDIIDRLTTELNNEKAKAQPDQSLINNIQSAIDSLNTQTSGSAVSEQITKLQTQITTLQNDINNETDPDIKSKKQSTLITLQKQLASLDTSPQGKLAALNLAKARRDAAKSTYETSRDLAINKFKVYYCITTETKDKDGKVVSTSTDCTHYIDNTGGIRQRFMEDADSVQNSYPKCSLRTDKLKLAQDAYDQSVTAETQAKSSYDALNAVANGSTPVSALERKVWGGAYDALNAVDGRGGMR